MARCDRMFMRKLWRDVAADGLKMTWREFRKRAGRTLKGGILKVAR